ncbi:autolysin [Pontimonas salivibrio]|uniref:Autolysin n=2 Tax=Pontimonas salivibrio TaxID=1159327 RepID=A0A2L2BQI7_9MICO|nr:autolysin [Pontimonas salivibrio]
MLSMSEVLVSESPEHDPAMGRAPRDDHFFFGDPQEAQHAPEILHGLRPRHLATSAAAATTGSDWTQRTIRGGLPLLMTGSLAAGVGVTNAMPAVADTATEEIPGHSQLDRTKNSLSELIAHAFVPLSQRVVNAVSPHVPNTYKVRSGETVTAVAEKFQIPTALLLSLNGLSWNSILHEGQVLRLTMAPSKQRGMAPPRVSSAGYHVEPGDTLAKVAQRLGVSERALAEANDMEQGTPLTPGSKLSLPGSTAEMAPRTVASQSSVQAPNIVLASLTDSPERETNESSTERDSDDPGRESDQEAASGDDHVNPHPLGVDVLPAPELRPEKKAAPTPPPAPTPAPVAPAEPTQAEKKDRDDSDDERSSSDESATESSVGQPKSGAVTPLNDVRRENASIIVQVGRDLGVPDYGIVIALATAMQESSLRNINWGDRDSVGLYQQRPSSGWGTVEQIMDPVFASKAFYGGPSNPNPGKTRGLLDYSGWQSLELTVAAQRVQRSAYPDAYAKWEASAWAWLDELS